MCWRQFRPESSASSLGGMLWTDPVADPATRRDAQVKELKEEYVPGQQLNVDDMFKAGDLVDIAGTTIGKGFQGA